jgi:flagellar biosynthesis/type III secretory pathway chaperone
MEHILEELIAIIGNEIDAFNDLLNTLHEKQRAIVEGEISRLNKHVQNETRLANETRSLEVERIERSKQLAEELDIESLNPKLSEIIEKVEEKYAQRLSEQRELLISLVQKVRNLNESNQFLLNYSLKFIEKNMEMLFGDGEQPNIYKKDGKLHKDAPKSKLFDHSV